MLMINVLCVLTASAAAATGDGKTDRPKPNSKKLRKKVPRYRIILLPSFTTMPPLGDNALRFKPILLIIALSPAALIVEFIGNARYFLQVNADVLFFCRVWFRR